LTLNLIYFSQFDKILPFQKYFFCIFIHNYIIIFDFLQVFLKNIKILKKYLKLKQKSFLKRLFHPKDVVHHIFPIHIGSAKQQT
jgi:hypothetical protein